MRTINSAKSLCVLICCSAAFLLTGCKKKYDVARENMAFDYFYALIYQEFAEQGSLGRKILEKYNITKNSPVVVKLKLNENILR